MIDASLRVQPRCLNTLPVSEGSYDRKARLLCDRQCGSQDSSTPTSIANMRLLLMPGQAQAGMEAGND